MTMALGATTKTISSSSHDNNDVDDSDGAGEEEDEDEDEGEVDDEDENDLQSIPRGKFLHHHLSHKDTNEDEDQDEDQDEDEDQEDSNEEEGNEGGEHVDTAFKNHFHHPPGKTATHGMLHDEEEDDEDDIDADEKDDESGNNKPEILGGTIDSEAFGLLTGVFFEDPNDFSQKQLLSIPITRLPATLGRSHDTSDKNFFGLGTRKVLSRNQAVIIWRDRSGGQLVQSGASEKLIYQPPPPKGERKSVLRSDPKEPLPELGFFAIESLGKNRIIVDGQRLDQGDVALLRSGSSVKMSSYHLLFLLPEDASEKIMTLPNPAARTTKTTSTTSPSAVTSSSAIGVATSGGSKAGNALSEQLDKTPVNQLLKWFFEAIEKNQWERRHQMIGGAITLHACLDAARSPKIQKMANAQNGVSRSEVMDWIKDSKRYSEWVKHVTNKMELKSYQANVTKCLWKAGYRRNAPVGRFVRWNLPPLEELGPGEPTGTGDELEDDDNEDNDAKGDRINHEHGDESDDERGEADHDDLDEQEDSNDEGSDDVDDEEEAHDDTAHPENDSDDVDNDEEIEGSGSPDEGMDGNDLEDEEDQLGQYGHFPSKRLRLDEGSVGE